MAETFFLSLGECAHVLSKLVSLAENYYRFGTELEKQDVIAFQANLAAIESFASNAEELNLHRMIQMERSKEKIGNPFSGPLLHQEFAAYKSPYCSPLLAKLNQEIDPEGRLCDQIETSGLDEWWRLEIDPCYRAEYKLSYERKTALRYQTEDEFRRLRQVEILRMLPPPHKHLQLQATAANSYAYDFFESQITGYGFERNEKLSTKGKVIFFTKPIGNQWVLNLTLLNDKWGFDTYSWDTVGGVRRLRPKTFDIHLDLRPSKKRGFTDYLPIQIGYISPLGPFEYSAYLDMDELAVAIVGYAKFYGLIRDQLEDSVSEALKDLQ